MMARIKPQRVIRGNGGFSKSAQLQEKCGETIPCVGVIARSQSGGFEKAFKSGVLPSGIVAYKPFKVARLK